MPTPLSIAAPKPLDQRPARIGPMAQLPVFIDLAGKAAVVVGGSAATSWKAELLVAAGATVAVFADEFSPEMVDLAAASDGRIVLDRRRVGSADLAGAAIAV